MSFQLRRMTTFENSICNLAVIFSVAVKPSLNSLSVAAIKYECLSIVLKNEIIKCICPGNN